MTASNNGICIKNAFGVDALFGLCVVRYALVHGKKGFVIPTKSFVKIGIAKIFCYINKMFSSINKTFGCCSKIFG